MRQEEELLFQYEKQNIIQKHIKRDFLGGPVISALPMGGRFNPGQGQRSYMPLSTAKRIKKILKSIYEET